MNKIIIFFLFPIFIYAQSVTFSGKVIDARTKEVLPGASIYIPGSSIGTTSDFEGNFNIQLPINAKELVISFMGYYTANIPLNLSEEEDFSKTVLLREKSKQLNELVLVKQKRDSKWKHWLIVFEHNFLGNSTLAEKAKILNPESLYFEEIIDSTGYLLKANSNKPLQIINKATGYLIAYDLIDFTFFDSKTHESQVFFIGYAFFEDIIKKERLNTKKVTKNRLQSYKGSTQHFIKSVFADTFSDEGFSVNHFIIKDNPAYPSKEQLKEMKAEAKKTDNYSALANLPSKQISILGREYIKKDFISESENQQYFSFKDYIYIVYKNEKTDANYHPLSDKQISYIKLNEPVEIYKDGFYFHPMNLIQYEYMGWKKIGDALPLDYEP